MKNISKPIRKKSKNVLPMLKAEAWSWRSICIRLGNANEYGMVECISCGKIIHWKESQAGHFIHNYLDYNDENVNPQCGQCNCFKKGNLRGYVLGIEKKYGFGVVQRLEDLKRNEVINKVRKDREYYREKIEYYKDKAYKLGYK